MYSNTACQQAYHQRGSPGSRRARREVRCHWAEVKDQTMRPARRTELWRRTTSRQDDQALRLHNTHTYTRASVTQQQQQPFYGPFPRPPGWAGARRELLDFMVQGDINRGRYTDHPAGRHSIRLTSAHLHHPPLFLQAGCPSCRPTNSVKALKATSVNIITIKQTQTPV